MARPRTPARGSAAAGRRPPSTRPSARGAPSKATRREAHPQPASRAKLTGRAAVLFLVLAVLGVSYASSVRAYLQQRGDLNTLSAQIAASKARIASLEQSKQRWHDPAYIRTQARERFGWLMPGENGYRVIDEHGHLIRSGSRLSTPAATEAKAGEEWWQRAWGSVVAAGRYPTRADDQPMPTAPSVIGKTPRYRAPVSLRPKLVLDTGASPTGR